MLSHFVMSRMLGLLTCRPVAIYISLDINQIACGCVSKYTEKNTAMLFWTKTILLRLWISSVIHTNFQYEYFLQFEHIFVKLVNSQGAWDIYLVDQNFTHYWNMFLLHLHVDALCHIIFPGGNALANHSINYWLLEHFWEKWPRIFVEWNVQPNNEYLLWNFGFSPVIIIEMKSKMNIMKCDTDFNENLCHDWMNDECFYTWVSQENFL